MTVIMNFIFALIFRAITLILICKEIHCYNRTLENEMIEFFKRINGNFTAALKNVEEYSKITSSDSSTPSPHEITGSCRKNDYLLNYLLRYKQNVSAYYLTIGENGGKYLNICIYDKNKNSTFNNIIGICLKKSPLNKLHGKSPAAAKILGISASTNGHLFACNLKEQNLQPTITTEFTLKMETKQNQYLQQTIPDGGWFLCGTAVGIIASSAVFCAVWKYSVYKNRQIENQSKNTNEKTISSVYNDIDEYELMPIYRDPVKRERFTEPGIRMVNMPSIIQAGKIQSEKYRADTNMDAYKDIDMESGSTEITQIEQSNGSVDPDYDRKENHELTMNLPEERKSDPYFVLAKRTSNMKTQVEFQDSRPDSQIINVKEDMPDLFRHTANTREDDEGTLNENMTLLSDDANGKTEGDTYFVIDALACQASSDK